MAKKIDNTERDWGTGLTTAAPAANAIPYVGPIVSAGMGVAGGMLSADAAQKNNGAGGYSDLDALYADLLPGADPRSVGGRYDPTMVKLDQYGQPILAQGQGIADSDQRQAQINALQQLAGYQNGAAGLMQQAQLQQAISGANQEAQRIRDSVSQNAQARGTYGSSQEYLGQLQAGQQAANTALSGGLQAAQMRALQQIAASQGLAQGLSGVRQQDIALNSANADIINKFNLYNNQMQNAIQQRNTDIRNQQGLYNNGLQNSADQYNLSRSDANRQQAFNNKIAIANGRAGIGGNAIQAGIDANNNAAAIAAKTASAGGKAVSDWAQGLSGYGESGTASAASGTPAGSNNDYMNQKMDLSGWSRQP